MKTDRAALLDTALALFHDRGFAAVTIVDIGAEVGVTGAAIYRHFRSKGDVLGSLCEITLDRLTDCTGDVRSDARDELDALVTGQVNFVVQNPKLLSVTLLEGRALMPPWRETIERRQHQHLKRWKVAMAGQYPTADRIARDVAIYGAIGLINSAVRWPTSLRASPDFEKRLTVSAYQTLTALTGASEGSTALEKAYISRSA